MILPITLTIAGAAALLNIWLAMRVGSVRRSQRISIGDGGDEALVARMRAQANFVEYTPFVLILLGLVELARGTGMGLWAMGVIYIVARIMHMFGMDPGIAAKARLWLRGVGIGLTFATLIGLAAYAIAIPYLSFEAVTTEVMPVG